VLGVIFMPLWVKALLSSGSSAGVQDLSIDYIDIFVKLLISILVPTVVGKVCIFIQPLLLNQQDILGPIWHAEYDIWPLYSCQKQRASLQ
jgi:predicted Na+-dependent transporter